MGRAGNNDLVTYFVEPDEVYNQKSIYICLKFSVENK